MIEVVSVQAVFIEHGPQRSMKDLLGEVGRDYFVSASVNETLQDEEPLPAGETTEVRIIVGDSFSDRERTKENIHAAAMDMNLKRPQLAHSVYLRLLGDEALKSLGILQLYVMHEEIMDDEGYPVVIGMGCYFAPRRMGRYPTRSFPPRAGFAYLAPL